MPSNIRAVLLLGLLLDGAQGGKIHVSAGARNLALHAYPAVQVHEVPVPNVTLKLVFARDLCVPLDVSQLPSTAFALFVPRGSCADDTMLGNARLAGASVLLMATTLATLYQPRLNDTVSSIALSDPCQVDCRLGRGVIETRNLDLPAVLAGMNGHCPAPSAFRGKSCPTNLCGFSSISNTTSVRATLAHGP